jgi:virginiamycin A acetyltransferase
MFILNPEKKYPFREELENPPSGEEKCIFLKHFITKKNISVGDYTYYHDLKNPENFENQNVPYLFEFSKEKLIIGKFCSIAANVKFITSSANHKLDGFSTYPFGIFIDGLDNYLSTLKNKGDTIVENDVWFGAESVIMPAVKIVDILQRLKNVGFWLQTIFA